MGRIKEEFSIKIIHFNAAVSFAHMRKPFPFPPLNVFFFSFILFSSYASSDQGKRNCYSSCGSLRKITYPWRLQEDPQGCGRSESLFELTCENSTQPVIHLTNGRYYYVKEISYEREEIWIVDPGLENSSLPLYNTYPFLISYYDIRLEVSEESSLVFVNCSQAVNRSSYVATAPCNLSSPHEHVYAMMGDSISVSQLHNSCRVAMNIRTSNEIRNLTS